MSELTEWLKQRLAGDPRSIRELADEIGVSHTTLRNWLAGSRPSWEACALIADFFGVSEASIRRLAGYDAGAEARGPVGDLSPEEEAIVRAYRAGNPEGRRALLGVARVVSASAMESVEPPPEERT